MGPALAKVVWEYFHPAAMDPAEAGDSLDNGESLELAG